MSVHDTANPPPLDAAQLQLLEGWVQLADGLGVSRSIGQLYGLLFVSEHPLSAADCVFVLKMSRSSAGQGLKALKALGAIRSVFEPGARQEAYVIEPDLGVLLLGVLEGRLLPSFTVFTSRMQSEQEMKGEPVRPFILERIEKLVRWQQKFEGTVAALKGGLK